MQVTDVRIRKARHEGEGRLLATASVVFDAMFVVHDVRVVRGTNGPFVAMPRRKRHDGEKRDVCHPITSECREMIQRAVLEEWKRLKLTERE